MTFATRPYSWGVPAQGAGRLALPDQLTAGFQELAARSVLLERDAHDLRGAFQSRKRLWVEVLGK